MSVGSLLSTLIGARVIDRQTTKSVASLPSSARRRPASVFDSDTQSDTASVSSYMSEDDCRKRVKVSPLLSLSSACLLVYVRKIAGIH